MKYTYAQLAKEARREADKRREVYRRMAPAKGLTNLQRHRIDMMDFLAVHLEELSEKAKEQAYVQPDLLGGGE